MHNKDSAAPVPDRRVPSHPRRSQSCKLRLQIPCRAPTRPHDPDSLRTIRGRLVGKLRIVTMSNPPPGLGTSPGQTPPHSMCALFCGSQDPQEAVWRSAGRGNRIAVVPRRPPPCCCRLRLAAHHLAPHPTAPAPSNRRCWLDRAAPAPRACQGAMSEILGVCAWPLR